MSLCPSVRPSPVCQHGKTQLPLDGLSFNFMFEQFSKTCQENSNFVRIWQDQRVFYMKTNIIFDNISLSPSQNEKCFRQMYRKSKHILLFNNFIRKSRGLWDNVDNFCTAEKATDGNVAHTQCMQDNQGYRHTLRTRNTYCFSTGKH